MSIVLARSVGCDACNVTPAAIARLALHCAWVARRSCSWTTTSPLHHVQHARTGLTGALHMQAPQRFNRVPEKVPKKVWEALVQSRVRFNRVPKKVPEKVPEGLGAARFRRLQGSRAIRSVSAHLLGHVPTSFGRKDVKMNFCCCWGYPRSLGLFHSYLIVPEATGMDHQPTSFR